MKKTTNNSKVADVSKTIFSGIGKILTAIALLVGLAFLCPVLLGVGAVIIQIGGWVVLFGVVIILPIWGVGKLFGGKKKPTFKEEEAALRKEINAIKRANKMGKENTLHKEAGTLKRNSKIGSKIHDKLNTVKHEEANIIGLDEEDGYKEIDITDLIEEVPESAPEEVDYKALYEEKLKAATEIVKREYQKKAAALTRGKRAEFNKKVGNLKGAVKAFWND